MSASSSSGNPLLFFSSDDNSKHLKEKRHALLFTARSSEGKPMFKLGTTSAAVTADGEGNSDLNVSSLRDILGGEDGDGLRALFHYGGGTTDNASDAINTTRLTFDKVMASSERVVETGILEGAGPVNVETSLQIGLSGNQDSRKRHKRRAP